MDDLRGELPDPAVGFCTGLLHQTDDPRAALLERGVLAADGLSSRAVTREPGERALVLFVGVSWRVSLLGDRLHHGDPFQWWWRRIALGMAEGFRFVGRRAGVRQRGPSEDRGRSGEAS